ncbi:MAG: hypothetical protein WCD07_05340 [Burkholderiales bacterium]
MGFLDELKSQADSLTKEKQAHSTKLATNAELVDARMRQAFKYFNDLSKQLEIIKPPSVQTFELHGIGKFDKLMLTDFFADYRRKKFNDSEVFDIVTLAFKHTSAHHIALKKDMPNQIEQCENALWRHNLKFQRENIRNEDGKLRWTEFTIPCSVNAEVSVQGDYEYAQLIFKLKNFECFETITVAFAAPTFGESILEDLARMIVGQPNRLLAQGQMLAMAG